MYSEEEIKKMREEMSGIDQQIRDLNKRKDELKTTILRNSAEIVKSRFPNLEYGDKVKVTRKDWWGIKQEEVTEILFFGNVCRGKYDYELTPNAMKWVFLKVKNDGTMSKRSVEYSNSAIVNIEKISDEKI